MLDIKNRTIGIDFHGTIDKYTHKFSVIMETLIKNGNTVYVISGPVERKIIEKLTKLGFKRKVHYTDVISIVDFLLMKKESLTLKDTGWWTDDETWWSSKARICSEFDINVLVDNDERYRKYFPSYRDFILVE